jgi:hypothetical protein
MWYWIGKSRDQSVCKSTAFSRMKGAPDYEQVQAYWKHTEKVEELGLKDIILYIINMLKYFS